MSYRVRLTKSAAIELEERIMSLSSQSPDAARRLNDKFEEALFRLRDFPSSCGLAFENPRFSEEVRHLLFGVRARRRYRALFTIRGDEVVVLAIRAPGERDVEPRDIADET